MCLKTSEHEKEKKIPYYLIYSIPSIQSNWLLLRRNATIPGAEIGEATLLVWWEGC